MMIWVFAIVGWVVGGKVADRIHPYDPASETDRRYTRAGNIVGAFAGYQLGKRASS